MMRYFVDISASGQKRYCWLRGKRVFRVSASRPDGVEVMRPAKAVFALEGNAPSIALREPAPWHNVPREVMKMARNRGGRRTAGYKAFRLADDE